MARCCLACSKWQHSRENKNHVLGLMLNGPSLLGALILSWMLSAGKGAPPLQQSPPHRLESWFYTVGDRKTRGDASGLSPGRFLFVHLLCCESEVQEWGVNVAPWLTPLRGGPSSGHSLTSPLRKALFKRFKTTCIHYRVHNGFS